MEGGKVGRQWAPKGVVSRCLDVGRVDKTSQVNKARSLPSEDSSHPITMELFETTVPEGRNLAHAPEVLPEIMPDATLPLAE